MFARYQQDKPKLGDRCYCLLIVMFAIYQQYKPKIWGKVLLSADSNVC